MSLAAITLCLVWCSCADRGGYYATEEAWIKSKPNKQYADVIYFVSTNILSSKDAEGNESFTAALTEDEREVLGIEIDYVHQMMFPDSLNFYSPIYHQFTMASIGLSMQEFQPVYQTVTDEVCSAFDYYMKHENKGRPFIIAGFSQGAMMVKELLKHMTDEQYRKMIAAYMIGYELTEEDLQCPHIKPATCATDKGVVISFNSVASDTPGEADPATFWSAVIKQPAVCINPVNWRTDSTPATVETVRENGTDLTLTVAVDTKYNVVTVTGYGDELPNPGFEAPWQDGCLHHEDLVLYPAFIGRNALDRAY